jgi:CDP-Glycerol:Poly(glycerophosphate) glycerophosphotransferase
MARVPTAVARAGRLARVAGSRLRNELRARDFADRAGANGMVPNGGVAVFFATGPENLYQFEQWRQPLERLAERLPVFVITDRADTGERLLKITTLPLVFARGSAPLESLVEERDVRVVLYLNQVEANFRMLRFAAPVHIQLGHGESDKGSSISNQHKAYDLTFVGGAAGRDRLGAALRDFDADVRTVQIGRPQLDHDYPGAPDWSRDSGFRVWYAPTWEGDRASIAYGSLASHGLALVEALIADPRIRVIYRPHPRTGTASAAHAAADKAIRARLDGEDGRHLIDEGGYGWQWDFADACVTDISAVAYDWLATGKPLVITEPEESKAYRPPSPILDTMPLLPGTEAGRIVDWLIDRGLGSGEGTRNPQLTELAEYYFGDTAHQASSARLGAAIDRALEAARPHS